MTAVVAVSDSSRLVAHDGQRQSFDEHVRRLGALACLSYDNEGWSAQLLAEIERSGLAGRGGAGFPSFRKLSLGRSAAARPTLVVNAMEGEPASAKDRFLIERSPHLVLDGVEVAARVLDARDVALCVPVESSDLAEILAAALCERAEREGSPFRAVVRALQGRYVAGEESALVASLAGGPAVPSFRPDKSVPLQIGRRAAVVHNVETLANIALIARHGADWFRGVGAPEAPGTCLVTISGAVDLPGVVEVPTGTRLDEILEAARPSGAPQAVLVGGYGGVWVRQRQLAISYAPAALGAIGATMGVGVLVVLGQGACGVLETARIARYMASQSAGQCGPCLFGLPAIAEDLGDIARGHADPTTLDRLTARCGAVDGRGACRHPDGVVRLVRSALKVFSDDVGRHVAGAPCAASPRLLVPPDDMTATG